MRIRDYEPTDEDGWLRCRLLSFLYSGYRMDVKTAKTANVDISLVALDADEVVGLLDIETEGTRATIDTIAVHPGHSRRGIASALLKAAMPRLVRRERLRRGSLEPLPAHSRRPRRDQLRC